MGVKPATGVTTQRSKYGSEKFRPPVDTHSGNDLMLRDGVSFFLLRDSTSTLQLGH